MVYLRLCYLYLSPYHWKTSTKAPVGFYIYGQSRRTSKGIASPKIAFKQKSAHEEYLSAKRSEEEQKRIAKERLVKRQQEKVTQARLVKEYQRTKFKTNWELYQAITEEYGINSLYHFTERSNLTSIKRNGGLFSWHYCVTNGIEIPTPGGNQLSRDLDTRKGLQNFVRASFTRNHPMMYVQSIRDRDNVILELDPEILLWKETKYANMNATRNDVNVGDTLDDFKQLRFELFKHPNHFSLSDEERPYFQGEILINEQIPLKYILNINELLK